MSTAHRPTWDPAQAKDSKAGSRQFSVRDMASHTKLKFRQVGQTSTDEVRKRDLRAELLAAEREAVNKKRKAEGKALLPPIEATAPSGLIAASSSSSATPTVEAIVDAEQNKRRKLLQEALELDKDDDSDSEEEGKSKGKEKDENAMDEDGSDEEEDDDDDDDDDEDETNELLRELEKIKRERAEEKDRQDRDKSASNAALEEADIATRNPLLNLAAALGQAPTGLNTTAPGSFQVKKRWDDDLIFKNQAANSKDQNQDFINDLLRTQFHKCVYSMSMVYLPSSDTYL
ncbi:Cwf15/Cwc15 cell cycle control protein [Coprinopsis marcescibilis]|uniref:Cwf15/Cwc15 cell cycle control protein n=1 Tax=Coprinopsis marcescibilis TaxID=230819 RepID=A0A5C3L0T9_COPMA|nr:Cwf15/Cwc15 cell cycle control protein [Coprinopsis marcescibilis]